MKNEELELLFLLVKREEGKIALTQLLNEECRMKNEKWELLFLFVKREEGKIALTQWDYMVERLYGGNGWAVRTELVIFFRSLELRSNNLLLQGDA